MLLSFHFNMLTLFFFDMLCDRCTRLKACIKRVDRYINKYIPGFDGRRVNGVVRSDSGSSMSSDISLSSSRSSSVQRSPLPLSSPSPTSPNNAWTSPSPMSHSARTASTSSSSPSPAGSTVTSATPTITALHIRIPTSSAPLSSSVSPLATHPISFSPSITNDLALAASSSPNGSNRSRPAIASSPSRPTSASQRNASPLPTVDELEAKCNPCLLFFKYLLLN
jgi:hypothetical protein